MESQRLYRLALVLAIITIVYNVLEGIIATSLGYSDESLALLGFGVDSFIEVISGIGIAHMVIRIQRNPQSHRDKYERTALRITGTAFFLLVVGLLVTSIYNLWTGHKPITTFWGVIISVISILVMFLLVYLKRKVGRALKSNPIIADANCTLVCIYMSIILLISSGVYYIFGWAFVDSLGTLGIAYFAFNEGKECFEKAQNTAANCKCD